MKKAVTVFRELKAAQQKADFNPSCRNCWETNYTKPSGIVRTMDLCDKVYNCSKCRDFTECNQLYETLINTNKIK